VVRIYQFRSKIKCLKCFSNFRGKLERNKNVYVCGGYSKLSSSCVRYVIHESDLIKIVEGHLKLKNIRVEGSLGEFIRTIEVTPNEGYKIYYNDGTNSIVSIDETLGIKYKL
jgi:hypothetical protein